jgi:hypothetical protein
VVWGGECVWQGFGHGLKGAWRKANWGIECDVEEFADRNGSGRFVEMTETGRVFFKGTQYALRYAVNRLAGGEPVEQTLARLPGLGQEYAGFLASLMKNETLARRI